MRLIKCCKLRTPKPFCAPDNTITKLGKLPPPVRKAQRSILHDIGLGTPRLNQSKNHANSAVKRHFWAQNLSRGSAPHPARASALDPPHEPPPGHTPLLLQRPRAGAECSTRARHDVREDRRWIAISFLRYHERMCSRSVRGLVRSLGQTGTRVRSGFDDGRASMLACCIPRTQTRDKGPGRDWKGSDPGRDWDPGIHMHTRKSPERSPLTDGLQ